MSSSETKRTWGSVNKGHSFHRMFAWFLQHKSKKCLLRWADSFINTKRCSQPEPTLSKRQILQPDIVSVASNEVSSIISGTDNCLKTTIFHIKLPPFRQLHGLTVMKGLQKQKRLITPSPFFCSADHPRSSRCWNGSPLWRGCHEVFLHVLTEESFLLFTPELACHIYRSRLWLCSSGASGRLIHSFSSW